MAAETQYTANTGLAIITTGNTSLTGSGTLNTDIWNVITGASNGTLIKSVTIKAQVTTTQGMVRLFIYDGTNTKLLLEVPVDAVTQSPTDATFGVTVPLNFTLKSGWILRATTQNSERFGVIAEGQDWAYYTTSVRPDTTKYTVANGFGDISTANSNLDGTGTIAAFTTSTGTRNVLSITTQAIGNTVAGMVRLYVRDVGVPVSCLFAEIPVPAITQSATVPAFHHKIMFPNFFALKNTYNLLVTTQYGDSFVVSSEVLEWTYP